VLAHNCGVYTEPVDVTYMKRVTKAPLDNRDIQLLRRAGICD
jgi:hypothetical protein